MPGGQKGCTGRLGARPEMATEALLSWTDIIGQRPAACCHGSSQSEEPLLWRGVKVSKEGAKKAAFVPTLSYLLSDPCGGDVAWGQSQQLLAAMARRGPREGFEGPAGLGQAQCVAPCSCLCLRRQSSGQWLACQSPRAQHSDGSRGTPATIRPQFPYVDRGTILTFQGGRQG